MKLPAINLKGEMLSRLDDTLHQEWLLTNGLGSYSSTTVFGMNTRKYHGLLVAALHPPGDRTVCLAKLDEDAAMNGEIYQLNANEFKDKIYPRGYQFQKTFSLSPFPTYVYQIEGFRLKKTIFMPRRKNVVAILYRAQAENETAKLRLYPMLTCRHFHSVICRAQNPVNLKQENYRQQVELRFNAPKAAIIISATEGEFVKKPMWIDRLHYREEAARGESCEDDLYQPGFFEVQVSPTKIHEFAIFAAASEEIADAKLVLESVYAKNNQLKNLLNRESKNLRDWLSKFYSSHPLLHQNDPLSWLVLAANNFVVGNAEAQSSIIAGYHWFEAWGRDTFISLPCLTLVIGRFEDAKRIFKFFANNLRQGLIPNYISDKAEEPAYNTVDASLWYINSVLQYLKYTGDFAFVRQNLWESIKNIMDNYQNGTLFDIHMDSDGLIAHGPRLTWMDAEVNGEAVTPRAGKAVEIQALWYNALKTIQLLAKRFDDESRSQKCVELTNTIRKSFNGKFWNEEMSCLFDTVSDSGFDDSMRPNQVISAALDFPLISEDRAEQVLDIVQRRLFTPCGLRTLDKNDHRYVASYAGDRLKRDQAYHNGTVWAWLIGPFTTAFVKTKGCNNYSREYAATKFILPLFNEQIFQAGLGTISEIFDGDPPHTPRGCISQAWSVAEPLRVYIEEIMQVRPAYEREVLQP